MVLKFSGQFNKDVDISNRDLLGSLYKVILNVKSAHSIEQIHNLKKLRKYKTHYRIKIGVDYRIGIIIRKNTVWFACFGHRSNFYKAFP